MKNRVLGRTGFVVSEIGAGLWGMGGWSGSDDSQSRRSLQLCVENGCTFFDSAHSYGDGHSDQLLGELLANSKERALVSASKIPPKNRKWPASPNDPLEEVFPVDHVVEYAEKIRDSLGVNTIDLLQYHVWDDTWTADPQFERAISELRKRSLIKSFGLSLNRWEPWNGLQAIRTGLVDVVQVIYNIFDQAPEDELFPECADRGVGIIARVPLDEGSLGGELTRDTRFAENDWRARYFGPENLPETLDRVELIKRELPSGMTLPQVALRFILSNTDVSTVIVGMRSEEHVLENLRTSDAGGLSAELIQRLRAHRWDRVGAPWSS